MTVAAHNSREFPDMQHDHQRKEVVIQQQAARIEELEQELRIVRRQLEQFQGRQMDDIMHRRRAAMDFYREEYERTHGASRVDGVLRVAEYEGDGLDEIDCIASQNS